MSSESKANLKAMAYISVCMAIVWTVVYSASWVFGFEVPQTHEILGLMALAAWTIALVYASAEHLIFGNKDNRNG